MFTKEFAYQFISQNRLCVVSTVSAEGRPEAALVGFAINENLEVIFDTRTAARKFQNLSKNPATAIVFGWMSDHTIQYEGVAETLSLNDPLMQTYFDVYPDGRERAASGLFSFIVVRPKWIRYCEFMRPPKMEELQF